MRVFNCGASNWGALAPSLAASLLIGCGGGMGGSGYGGSMPPPPSVNFMTPAQALTINLGQGVNLSWTSANVSSCTASTSNAMAGDFTGSQSLSGSIVVAPTAAGSTTYTLMCSGTMSGTASATTAMVTVNPSILSTLSVANMVSIGPTLDRSANMFGGNPYGLAIAPISAGLITAGDLIVCNFNSGALGTQGSGTTIVGLHVPAPGAAPAAQLPYLIANDPAIAGCSALAMLPDDSISAAAFSSGMSPLVTPSGSVTNPFAADAFGSPWGEVFVPTAAQVMGGYGVMGMGAGSMSAGSMSAVSMSGDGMGGNRAMQVQSVAGPSSPTLYVSTFDGSIDRIELSNDAQSSFTQIATGFCGSGSPGAIFAPAGLTYDPSIDTLYIIDTSSNSVVAFANVSSIGAAGVVVDGQCAAVMAPPTPAPTFSGPSASLARVVATGAPLISPISAALLADGNLIVGNGDDSIGATQIPNLVVEISPVLPGGFVGDPVQLDPGTNGPGAVCGASVACGQGALFGIAATVDSAGKQRVYFNDDNSNAVMLITQ
jgi:hypothetical protein